MNKATEETMSGTQWLPGDRVWYKSGDGFEPRPELFVVVAEDRGVVWIRDELEDKLVFSHELSPFTREDERKKANLATLYALLKQTSLSREEVGEVCSVLIGAGMTFDKEENQDEIG